MMISVKKFNFKNLEKVVKMFGSSHSESKAEGYPDLSTFNPNAQPLNPEKAKNYHHVLPTNKNEQKALSLSNVLASNPITKSRAFLTLVAENFNKVENQDTSEYFHPPRVHENSIFIYQSRKLANAARFGRGTESLGLLFIAGLMKFPLYAIPLISGVYYYWANAWFYEMSRRLVVRMDLLPHVEMIHFVKIGAFGSVISKLARIDDLEKVNYEELAEKENYLWQFNHGNLDTNLIFRDKSTGEYFCFDKTGLWDHEGISHRLLN